MIIIKANAISGSVNSLLSWLGNLRETALIREDSRYDYSEIRYCALGYIGVRIYHLVFTYRADIVRVISLRKANKREVNRYAET